MKPGDHVNKKEGTRFPGIILCIYKNLDGVEFAVVELPEYKLQHIYRTAQLEVTNALQESPL